ncbi:hypothetical protein [Bacillus sp. MRMR6]|uniref:hypothetical protein n=1 Tax=Bacillus sp. MRMR6 TaxID=1928617 RepID=UPI000952B0A1|nr:hypothetical protein [Bacillus sp. MRMR6]OLS35569.1 hypothetical protein BTR25_19365 [Bacillus sp. MRMR6]
MIIRFDFGEEHIQYISCATKVGRKINRIRRDFENWIFDEKKNKKYWLYEEGEKYCPSYDTDAIIDWLNNVKFKKGTAKAKLISLPKLKVKKTLYF